MGRKRRRSHRGGPSPQRVPSRKRARAQVSSVYALRLAGFLGLWVCVTALYHSALEFDFVRSKHYPLLAGASFLMCVLGIAIYRHRRSLPRTPLEPLILIYLGTILISAVLAPEWVLSLPAFVLAAAASLGFWASLEASRLGAGVWVQVGVSMAGVAVAAIAVLQAADIPVLAARSASLLEVAALGQSALYRASSTLGHKNLVASFCVMTLGAALGLAMQGRRAFAWFFGTASCVIVAGLVVTYSRVGWTVGLFLVSVGAIGWYLVPMARHRGWAIGRLGAAAVATTVGMLLLGGLLLSVVRPELMARAWREISLEDPWNAFNHRGVHWLVAGQMVAEHPIFGVGPGHYGRDYTDYLLELLTSVDDPYRGGTQANSAHCDPLQVAAETGILGLVAYVSMWGAIFVVMAQTLQQAKGGERARLLGLTLGVAGFHLTGLMDFPGTSPPHLLAVWVMTGGVVGRWKPAVGEGVGGPEAFTRAQGAPVEWPLSGSPRIRAVGAMILISLGLMGMREAAIRREADRALVRGKHAYAAGAMARAKPEFEAALQGDPSLAQAHFWLGRIAHRSGDLSRARTHLERSRALWAFYPVDLALGFLALEDHRHDEAVEALRRYVAVRPMAPVRDYQLLEVALRRARLPISEHTRDMGSAAKRFEMGGLVETEGKLEEAFSWYMSLENDQGYFAAVRVAMAFGAEARAETAASRIKDGTLQRLARQVMVFADGGL